MGLLSRVSVGMASDFFYVIDSLYIQIIDNGFWKNVHLQKNEKEIQPGVSSSNQSAMTRSLFWKISTLRYPTALIMQAWEKKLHWRTCK
jgi:hypothetical protein